MLIGCYELEYDNILKIHFKYFNIKIEIIIIS